MLQPTDLGIFGHNSLLFAVPSTDDRFAQLLGRLNLTDSDPIVADAGRMFGPAAVSIVIERTAQPPHLRSDDDRSDTLTFIDISICDPDEDDAQPDSDRHFIDIMHLLEDLFEDPLTCHNRGQLSISRDLALLAAPLPIDLWNSGPIGTLLGGRFELVLPESEEGHIILDTHRDQATVTLHFDRRLRCSLENIATAWTEIRNIYNHAIAPRPTGVHSDAK